MVDGFKTETCLVNKNDTSWIDNLFFENYLRVHPGDLERYWILKENADGLAIPEYYRRKVEFINQIMDNARLTK